MKLAKAVQDYTARLSKYKQPSCKKDIVADMDIYKSSYLLPEGEGMHILLDVGC